MMNRRELGKGLFASTALAVSGPVEAQAKSKGSDRLEGLWTLVAPGVWKVRLGSPESITPVSSRLVPPQLQAMRLLPDVASAPMASPSASVGRRGVMVTMPLAAQEQIYGFGLQFFSVAQRAKKRVIRVNADPRTDTGDSHAPVPFYVSSLGYGILVDTARYATFYCGEARPKPTEASAEVSGGTVPLYTKSLGTEDSSQVLVEIPSAQGVDVYLFGGPLMLEVVRRYNLFSGGGVNPPEWGLGFWYRTASNATDGEILKLADEFRERKIPCDVIGLEAGWHTHAYSCTFAWHAKRFPEPGRFLKNLKERQYKVNLWEHAFTHPSSPLFTPMKSLSGDKGVWGGLVPDFGNPEARAVFGEYHGKQLIDLGVSGFKLDECDNSDYTGGWSFPEISQFPSGVDGEQMHNLFGLRYQAALWQQFKDRRQPTYSLVRSSGALAAPYPFVLYSDLYDHRQFVRALVNSGFSGLLWCPEVRDAKSEEDLVRRLQTVVFSPLAMINGWYIPNPPWKQLDRKKNNANELTEGWEELETRCREIIGWRMRLIPYLQAAFARYALDGTPPFRALALDAPGDPLVATTDDAWMVGDRMLVAPLFAGENGRKLVLPGGRWFNFWDGTLVEGGSVLEIAQSVKEIPVYVRDGSVIPMAAVTDSTADAERHQLEVLVFGDGHLPFTSGGDGAGWRVSWDKNLGVGSMEQKGDKVYSVKAWKQMGRA